MPHPDPRPITYDPPVDRAYPPRLLTPDGAIWLPAGRDVVILPDEVHVWNADGVCRIDRLPTASNREILLNGAPLVVEHVLQDGDFYWDGQDRFVFQADPVADRKRALAAGPISPILIPAQVAAKLRLDVAGITGVRDDVTLSWLEITRLQIRDITIFTRKFQVWTDAERPALRVKFGYRQLKQVLAWLDFALPFDIPVTWSQQSAHSPYQLAVQTKVIIPVAEGRRILPAEEAVLLGRAPWSIRRKVLAVVGGVILIGALMSTVFIDPAFLVLAAIFCLMIGLLEACVFRIIGRARTL